MKKMMLIAFALAGCATIPKSEQVKLRASHDLTCDADKVQTSRIDDHTFRASACGRQATYVEDCPFPEATRCTWVAREGVQATAPATGVSQ